MTKVIRNADGTIINIGPWDYKPEPVIREIEVQDEFGNPMVAIVVDGEVDTNPLPEGAYEDEAEIVTGWDGGLYEGGDPRCDAPN